MRELGGHCSGSNDERNGKWGMVNVNLSAVRGIMMALRRDTVAEVMTVKKGEGEAESGGR